MHFEIFHEEDNPSKWWWRLKFKGKTIATSHQGHDSPKICLNEIQNVQNSTNALIYDENGKHITDQSTKILQKLNVADDD